MFWSCFSLQSVIQTWRAIVPPSTYERCISFLRTSSERAIDAPFWQLRPPRVHLVLRPNEARQAQVEKN